MRYATSAVVAVVMGTLLLFAAGEPSSNEPAGNSESSQHGSWFKIVFGVDEQAATWDGRLSLSAGRILAMREWGLEARDQLDQDAHSWTIETGIPSARRVSFAEPMRGLLVQLEAPRDCQLRVETAQGDFSVRRFELTPGRPREMLAGRARVQILGTEQLVAETETDDDYTAIAVDSQGQRHVAWIAYDDAAKSDRLVIRNIDDPASHAEAITVADEFSTPHLVCDRDDVLRAFWCSPGEETDWDVYTAVRKPRGWQSQRLTTADGTDFELCVSNNGDGVTWLAWQSFRDGNGDIVAKRLHDGQWSADIRVTETTADEWQPSVSAAADGSAWIGYDTYENGNYDVYACRVSLRGNAPHIGNRIAVATSDDFEAHASVLVDGEKVWVAYDAAGPNWGKDFRNVPTISEGQYAEPLHASRRLELRLIDEDEVYEPTDPLPQILPPARIHAIERNAETKPSRFYEFPQLARGGDGRLWMLFRLCRQGYCPHPPKGACWKIYATTHTADDWLAPIELPESWGRQDQRVAATAGPDGRLHCAWSSGNRFAAVGRKYAVHAGALPTIDERVAAISVEPIDEKSSSAPQPTPQVPWSIERDGEEYHVYFGDLHRHTNISRCSPTVDGGLNDAHRYALNAAELDFLAITDHTRDVDPFSWWRTQKQADQFYLPGRYVTIFAYERSNQTPGGGHRNVFLLHRGAEVSRSDHWYTGRDLPRQDADPDTTLYPWMRERGDALTAAHTPVFDKRSQRGTWTYNDPQMEPVTEIFQGFRQSYERPGRGVAEQVAVWHALNKGYRLGFIASSDHISTHMSYACVWAKEKTREAIFEALAARRTYAAMDRIGLDVRIDGALMGEETEVGGDEIAVTIRAEGTAPIRAVEVVRSGAVIGTLHPGQRHVEATFVDSDPIVGESHYYVRLVQDDDAVAWGSPIWVTRK